MSAAILDPLSAHGGMHYYVHDQAASLQANGVRMTVFSPPTGLEAGSCYTHKTAFRGVYGTGSKPVRALRLMLSYVGALVYARMHGIKSCIFHIFKSDAFEAFAVAFAKLLGLKVYCVIHDVARLDAAAGFSLIRQIVGMSNGVIVHNPYSREALLAAAPKAVGKAIVVHHGNYIDRFKNPPAQATARATLSLPQDSLILLFFGNPRREKGLHILLEALVPLAGREDILLLVAGKMKAAEEAEVRDFVDRHDLGGIVQLNVGHVQDGDVPHYYRAASVVVLPYLRVYESGVGLMAMSFARPVLASNVPVFDDLVRESDAGLFFESGDPASLRAQILALLGDRQRCEALGENALAFARDKRSWAQVGQVLAETIGCARA